VSPSWIRARIQSQVQRLAARPEAVAGIAIGGKAVCAALIAGEPGRQELRAIEVRELARPLFAGPPDARDEANLAEALRAVSEAFRDRFAAVRIVLPDTVIRSAVFDLDELPKTEALRGALLRWRFATEWQRAEETLECRGADLGEDGGRKVYFGQAGDRPWLECVKRALAGAGITPWSLNAAAVSRFNCFHDDVAGRAGALLALDAECWNLQIWDAVGRMRRVLTRLRVAGAAEHEAIVNAAERAILAYVHEAGGRTVDSLYLTGDEAEVAGMAGAFNGRLREAAVWLRPDAKVAGAVGGMRAGLAPLALAAALGG
jgi:hypothetical protein